MKKTHGLSKKLQHPSQRRHIAQPKLISGDLISKVTALYQAGNLNEAELLLKPLLAADPANARILSMLATIHFQKENFEDSIQLVRQAIGINPRDVGAYYLLGVAHSKLQQYDAALASYDKALALNSNDPAVYYERGVALYNLRQYDRALASYSKTIAINPAHAAAFNDRGVTSYRLKRYSDALGDFDKAIAITPDYAEAHWHKGVLKLALGEYEEGWKLYEWRWKKPDRVAETRKFQRPLWSGRESLSGKTLVLYAEQGLGDTIQFCRYISLVRALGASVVVDAPASLHDLLSTVKCSFRILNAGESVRDFDFYCPLMSLPLAFQTTLKTIPSDIPYLYADPDRRREWEARLGQKTKPRVGLVWAGSATNTNDHNRSIPLRSLTRILKRDYEFHSLQKELRPGDESTLAEGRIISHESNIGDFADAAALISQMDVVISVDTSVAHLAGALGKPVWILLPFVADFRWLMDREDSPWYPTARLFRQLKPHDWDDVVYRLQVELKSNDLFSDARGSFPEAGSRTHRTLNKG